MATNDIRQRIGLDGGEEVKAQLDALGEAGKNAFQKLQDGAKAANVLSSIGPAFDAITAKASAVGQAFGDVSQKFSEVGTSVRTTVTNIAVMAAVIGGAVGGFVELVRRAAESTQALQNMASAIGLTVKQFEGLSYAFQQNGVDQDQFTRGMSKFNSALDNVAKQQAEFQKKQNALSRELGLGRISADQYTKTLGDMQYEASQNVNAFTRLGVAIAKNADGTVNTEETLKRVADAFAGMKDGAEKSGFAMELFGSKNTRFVSTLNGGRAGLEAYEAELRRIAPPLSEVAMQAGQNLTQAFSKLKTAMESLKNAALAPFFAPLAALVNAFTEAIVANRDAVIRFSEDLANKARPIIGDLIALLEGKDNQIQNGWILQARDAITEFATQTKVAVTEIIIPALRTLLTLLDQVAKAINLAFGTDFTGATLAAALVITKITGLFGVLRASISAVISVVRLLAIAFGGVEIAIAAIGFAVGYFGVKLFQEVGGWQGLWDAFWRGLAITAKAALDGILALLGIIGQGIAAGWDAVIGAIKSAFAALGDFLGGVFKSISQVASDTVQAIAQFFVGLGSNIASVFSDFMSFLSGVWQSISQAASQAAEAIVSGFMAAVQAVVGFFTNLPANIAAAFQAVLQAATDTWNGIVQTAIEVCQGVVAAFNSAIQAVTGYFQQLKDFVMGIFDAIISAAKAAAQAIASVAGGGSSGGSGYANGGEVHAATGGYIRGSGTSTSDSIRAWLSNGEFVHKAKAVRKYGTDFMHAINDGLVPVDAVRKLMGSFNTGGLVDALGSLMPRTGFADGGLVTAAAGGGRPVNINIGGESFAMNATGDVIDRLQRFASAKQVRSAGRKPTWFQG